MNLSLAVQNADVLRAIQAAPREDADARSFGRAIGKDPSNMAKTVAALVREGWVAAGRIVLTDEGAALLPRLDVLEGRTGLAEGVVTLTHAQLRPSPLNPRKDFDSEDAQEALDALRQSILTHGLQQNLVVRAEPDANGVRDIVAGESRWRAIGEAIADGDLPDGFPIPCRLQALSDEEHEELALIENMVRSDLHPLDEAAAFQRLRTRRSSAEIAEAVGRTQRHIQERIKLLELPKGDQARMRLPKDDPDHLTLTGARHTVQTPSKPEAEAHPAQVDVEDLAPRPAPLTSQEALILFEVEAAARARPTPSPVGPTTKIRREVASSATKRLIGEGMLLFSTSWPDTVTLLAPAVRWLASAPGAFMGDDFRLRMARKDAAIDADEIGELESAGDYATSWLNLPKPPPPQSLTDEEALILLEVLDADGQKNHGAYAMAQIKGDGAPELVKLVDRNLLGKPHLGQGDGFLRTTVLPAAVEALEARKRGMKGDKARRAEIARLREATRRFPGRRPADRDNLLDPGEDLPYATRWLNGPFKVDRAWREEHEAREAEIARAEVARTEMAAQHARLHDRVTEFEGDAATMTPEARCARLGELLAAANAPAPWRPNLERSFYDSPDAFAANGAGIRSSSAVCNRLQLIALNMAAGVDPSDWPPTCTTEPEGDHAQAQADAEADLEEEDA